MTDFIMNRISQLKQANRQLPDSLLKQDFTLRDGATGLSLNS